MPRFVNHDVTDIKLAGEGKLKIEWAGQQMPVLQLIKDRFLKEKPLKGITLGACLHVTSETANLMLALQAGGAKLALCASNPLSTQDSVAASLVKDYGVPTFAIKGEDNKTYYNHLNAVLEFKPQITMDDGADLINLVHKFKIQGAKGKTTIQKSKTEQWEFYGSSEETTTGVIRLKAMEKDKALMVPVVAVNDSDTKHLFDNRYGTGQSTIDGIMRATNILLAGKTFVVCGYGWCSRGIAMRAKGMGANVVVTEVDPVRALEAAMDGYRVMKISQAAKIGDIFVTATGDKQVISLAMINQMKSGAILANSGHFDVEVDVAGLERTKKSKRRIRPSLDEYVLAGRKKVYLLGEGRLVNLAAAEGHPAEVMDMSFANQALAAEYFIKNKGKLENKVYVLPQRLDQQVAKLKLKAMGMSIDRLTREQKKYLSSWQEGT
jgi:adenosylhomocysteinase